MGGFSKKEKLAYVRAKKHLLHKKVIAPVTTVDESEICRRTFFNIARFRHRENWVFCPKT